MAARWIGDCVENHGGCCPDAAERPCLPRRVLDVGAGPNDEIRLVETSNCHQGRYTCLSHCWGRNHPPLKTTRDYLASHLRGIPWRDIPATFRDAIRFTRHLGVRYLWIDSLCIIQDDEDDWARESGDMCRTYQNSYVTVAATSASDADGGLFLSRKNRLGIVEVAGVTSASQRFRVYGHKQYLHPDSVDTESWLGGRCWPLVRRGWVLQERLLSPRTVHFCSQELVWECWRERKCECNGPFAPKYLKSVHRRVLQQSSNNDGPAPSFALARHWQELVEVYSAMDLSFGSDKLPALSGLASQVAGIKRPGTRYLAGLWSDSLETDLLWITPSATETRQPGATSDQTWRAPSWSWVSLEGTAVVFPLSTAYCADIDQQTHSGGIRQTFYTDLDIGGAFFHVEIAS